MTMIVPLISLFEEKDFAWDLLECQIAVEMDDHPSGQTIAKLLEHYMRGVEKMNSLLDSRQSYFKNKMIALMMKGNVLKSFKKTEMKKRSIPIEVLPEGKNSQLNFDASFRHDEKIRVQQSSNLYGLQERKLEIEMRLAYEAQATTLESMKELYSNELKKEQKIKDRITQSLNIIELRLQERRNQRKLKTVTSRSRITQDTSIHQEDIMEQKISQQIIQNISIQPLLTAKKRVKSLEAKSSLSEPQSLTKMRKNQIDLTKFKQKKTTIPKEACFY